MKLWYLFAIKSGHLQNMVADFFPPLVIDFGHISLPCLAIVAHFGVRHFLMLRPQVRVHQQLLNGCPLGRVFLQAALHGVQQLGVQVLLLIEFNWVKEAADRSNL